MSVSQLACHEEFVRVSFLTSHGTSSADRTAKADEPQELAGVVVSEMTGGFP